MSVDTKRFIRQMVDASTRYETNSNIRISRSEALKHLGAHGAIKRVDTSERLVRRLRSLNRIHLVDELLSESRAFQPRPKLSILERIIGEDDFLSARFLPLGAETRKSVGRVILSSSGIGFGTGFMISPTLMMTNNHVIADHATASMCALEFDYYETRGGGISDTEVYSLNPKLFFETDEDLDFTIIAVESVSTKGLELSRGWSPLIPESGKALVSERVNIIQHPDGGPQKLALRSNTIVDVPGDFLHYVSDTRPGSSGSPVYNDQWELAALHHSGVPNTNENGEYLLTDGSVWDGGDATRDDLDWKANEGVRISSIVSHLNVFVMPTLDSGKVQLLSEIYVSSAEDGRSASVNSSPNTGQENTEGYTLSSEDGDVAVWEIPLTVRVNLGAGTKSRSSTSGRNSKEPHTAVQVPTASVESIAQERLNRFRDRPYYDEEADLESYHAYYADVPDSAYPEDWFRIFSELVSKTHSTQLTYKKARLDYLYPWVDLHETESGTGVLQSVYSGKSFEPLSIISQELLNERKRLETIRELHAGNSSLSQERLADQMELLEAKFPFNCEHVVPQSWFQKQEPMKSDLHHLFTCEWNCNSFRSNLPFFDFLDFDEKIMKDCGMREDDGFEPKAGKGAVARASLYYLLRYPGRIRDGEKQLVSERIETLVAWHKAHPVSRYELHRNAAIFEIQGNRNPLIDWPKVVEFTSFDLLY
ncbi:endonuclease [Granulosicoccus sp.]|nr:endonuclease [Granulosicoccus sp.]MDB4222926.1 endonuclease [Granulosicoccus sp.]